MNVQEYIENRKKELAIEKESTKAETLKMLGIYKKVFPRTPQSPNKDYPYFDQMKKNSYRIVTESITDEQYEELLKVIPLTEKAENNNAKGLSICGEVIIIFYIILSVLMFIFGVTFIHDENYWGWILIVSSIVSLPFTIGLGYLFKVVADILRSVWNIKE